MFAVMRMSWSGLVIVAACGPGLAPQPLPPPSLPAVHPGVPPPADEQELRKLLAGDVVNGGLWFADPECQAQFGHAGTIAADAYDAFAHCVAGLHLRPTGREDAIDDTSVLTDDAGFEIEAHIASGRLDFIGFSGRAPGMPDLPSITSDKLESLRTGGDSNATISVDEAKRLTLPNAPTPLPEHLRLCLADTGKVASIMPAGTTTIASEQAFAAVVRDWTFKPFVAGDKPMAVCAVVALRYPTAPRDTKPDRLPRPPRLSNAGHIVYNVSPVELERLRTAGTKLIVPDDIDKTRLNGHRLVGSFKLCLDETGHYERGDLLKSTGLPGYDAKIARELMRWAYRPYEVKGVAVPVCAAITFIYTQR